MENVATMGDMLMRQYPPLAPPPGLRKRAKGKAVGGIMIGNTPAGGPQPNPSTYKSTTGHY